MNTSTIVWVIVTVFGGTCIDLSKENGFPIVPTILMIFLLTLLITELYDCKALFLLWIFLILFFEKSHVKNHFCFTSFIIIIFFFFDNYFYYYNFTTNFFLFCQCIGNIIADKIFKNQSTHISLYNHCKIN
jgi:hypothetical protein